LRFNTSSADNKKLTLEGEKAEKRESFCGALLPVFHKIRVKKVKR
jgi:hypothetical protein